jgi:DNA polymerase-3 subunit alpha
MNTKKARNGNSRYLRCKVEDFTGAAECVMWPDDFVRYKDTVAEDTPCFVKGTVERTREEPGLRLTRIFTVEQAAKELATRLWLRLSVAEHGPRHIDLIAELLRRAPGRCPVFLAVRDARGRSCVLRLGRDFAIDPAAFPREELEGILGPGGVKLE